MRPEPSLVLTFRDEGPVTPWRPLRLLDAPGPALLRQNLSAIRTETNPPPARLARLATAARAQSWCLFDLDALGPALEACTRLADGGATLTAVRGRVVPAASRHLFGAVSFAPDLLTPLAGAGCTLPAHWLHPVILADAFHPGYGHVRYGVIFSRLPDPGLVDLQDVGRAGAREGACRAALDQALDVDELPALLQAITRAGATTVLLVDTGGPAEALAAALAARGSLGAWFAPARRPLPAAVRDGQTAVYTWLEPDDPAPPAIDGGRGCAFVPVGLPGEDVPATTARLLALRERGYGCLVPRFFLPVPNTGEWQALESAHPLRPGGFDRLDGRHLVFTFPGWEPARGPELLALWMEENRTPPPAPRSRVGRMPGYSLRAVGAVLDGYVAAAGSPAHHAREVLGDVLGALPAIDAGLTTLPDYPFVAWQDRSLLALVEDAIERRLRALDGVPEPLLRAVQHAVLTGGKRIRPVLSLVITCACGVPLDAAMPAALALEWLHDASLVQDDLPAMDDDPIRRQQAAAHVRHGEGLALLASDTLIAMAIEDIAALAAHPRVGPGRAVALLAKLARALGPQGLVGGQARDLLARQATRVGPEEVLAIHRRKTAPLFELAASLAVTLADVPEPLASRLTTLLADLGVAFQIVDDILDETPGNTAFGRPPGSDRRHRLPTFSALLGAPSARRYAERLIAPHLRDQGLRPDFAGLTRLARFVLDRRY